MSVGMTGDNYTSNNSVRQKTAAAIAVSGLLAANVMLCFFQLVYRVLTRPVHFTFTSFHIAMQPGPL